MDSILQDRRECYLCRRFYNLHTVPKKVLRFWPSRVWSLVVPSGWIPPKLILLRLLHTKYLDFLQFEHSLQKA